MQIIAGNVDLEDVGFEIAAAPEQGEDFLVFPGSLLGESRDVS